MRRRLVLAGLTVASLIVVAGTAARIGAPAAVLPRVTLIGDSVASAVVGNAQAIAILEQGIELRLEVAACRRVDAPGCPIGGAAPPAAPPANGF